MKKLLWAIVIIVLIALGLYLFIYYKNSKPALPAKPKAQRSAVSTPTAKSEEECSDIAYDNEACETPDIINIHDVRLELPAARKDSAYPEAVVVDVVANDKINYTSYYDKESFAALWVAYTITAEDMGDIKRPSSWSYNPEIEACNQVNLCSRSYNDGYARGHLIPNASRNGDAERQRQTFYVTNSVPQIQNGFNGGIWQRLEAAVQDIAQEERVYVTTGVAFNKCGENRDIAYTTAKMDDKQVPIPNYFYKVVLKVESQERGTITSAEGIGFWFEHRSYDDKFMQYAVSVDAIEEWTGFDFFAALPDAIEAEAEANTSWESFVEF